MFDAVIVWKRMESYGRSPTLLNTTLTSAKGRTFDQTSAVFGIELGEAGAKQ